MIIGIDPGHTGALAFLPDAIGQGKTHLAKSLPMPVLRVGRSKTVDVPTLVGLITQFAGDETIRLVAIEDVASRPGQGIVSTFNFGLAQGQLLGAVAAMQWPHRTFRPQEWQKAVGRPPGGGKDASLLRARSLFPHHAGLHGPRVQIEGRADALLIAFAGWRWLRGRG